MATRNFTFCEAKFGRQRESDDGQCDDRGRQAERDSFDDEALCQSQTARSERDRDGDFLACALGAEQEKVDDVGRRDEQHDRHQRCEEDEMFADRGDRCSLQ